MMCYPNLKPVVISPTFANIYTFVDNEKHTFSDRQKTSGFLSVILSIVFIVAIKPCQFNVEKYVKTQQYFTFHHKRYMCIRPNLMWSYVFSICLFIHSGSVCTSLNLSRSLRNELALITLDFA